MRILRNAGRTGWGAKGCESVARRPRRSIVLDPLEIRLLAGDLWASLVGLPPFGAGLAIEQATMAPAVSPKPSTPEPAPEARITRGIGEIAAAIPIFDPPPPLIGSLDEPHPASRPDQVLANDDARFSLELLPQALSKPSGQTIALPAPAQTPASGNSQALRSGGQGSGLTGSPAASAGGTAGVPNLPVTGQGPFANVPFSIVSPNPAQTPPVTAGPTMPQPAGPILPDPTASHVAPLAPKQTPGPGPQASGYTPPPGAIYCSNMLPFANNPNADAGPAIQTDILNAPSGATLLVSAGVYTLYSQVFVNKPLTIATYGLTDGVDVPIGYPSGGNAALITPNVSDGSPVPLLPQVRYQPAEPGRAVLQHAGRPVEQLLVL